MSERCYYTTACLQRHKQEYSTRPSKVGQKSSPHKKKKNDSLYSGPHWLDKQQKGTCCMSVTKTCSCADTLYKMACETVQTQWTCTQVVSLRNVPQKLKTPWQLGMLVDSSKGF